MMRKLVASLVAMFLLCALTACGEKQEEPPKETKSKQQQTEASDQQSSNKEQRKRYRLPTFSYRDDQFHFSLELPATWKDQFTVRKGNWLAEAETTLDFQYKNGGYTLFTIAIFPFDKQTWAQKNPENLWQYLGTNNDQNKTYAFTVPTEISADLLKTDPASVEKRAYVSHMINVDVPRIVQTFKLQ